MDNICFVINFNNIIKIVLIDSILLKNVIMATTKAFEIMNIADNQEYFHMVVVDFTIDKTTYSLKYFSKKVRKKLNYYYFFVLKNCYY